QLFSIADEDGTGVARPNAVGAPMIEANRISKRAGFLQDFARSSFGSGVVHDDVDFFRPREMADDLSVDMRDAGELSRPIVLIVRPGDPSSFVGLPLGGHAQLGMFRECAAAHS